MRKLKMNQMETTKGGWSPKTCVEDGVRNGALSVMSGLAGAASFFGPWGPIGVIVSAAAVGCILAPKVVDSEVEKF